MVHKQAWSIKIIDTFEIYHKPLRLTTSLQVGVKYFGCVVCRFHVAASAEAMPQTRRHQQVLVPLPKSASNNLRKWFLSPTGRLNFGFITEEKLTVVLITPYSWGSQLVYALAIKAIL
jgi:hypothetical protein